MLGVGGGDGCEGEWLGCMWRARIGFLTKDKKKRYFGLLNSQDKTLVHLTVL